MADAVAETPKTGALGERKLGTIHAVAQALAIGPMFSTALVLGGTSNPATGSGFNAALSVLLAGFGVLAIAYSLSLFARRYAGAGAVYEYLTHGAHPAVGVFTAGLFFVGTLFLGGGGIYLGLGILANGFWSAHISGGAPAWWVFALIALAIVLVFNYLGVRIATRAMLTFAAISFVPMIILGFVIVAKGGHGGNTIAPLNPGTTSVGTVFNGVLLGILLFVGFEAAASIGEESHDPHRSIPRGLLWTVAVSAAFYMVMAYAISIGYGQSAVAAGKWAGDPAYLDTMATQYIGSWYATIIDLIVLLDALGLALAICVTIGRGYFALGRDGLLPRVFAKTSRRYQTPWVGNLMVVVGCVALIIISEGTGWMKKFVPIFGTKSFSTFIVSATAGSFAIEFVYLILAVAAIPFLMRIGGKWWQYLIVLVAIAMPILGFKGALSPAPHDSSNFNWLAFYWALFVVVLSGAWFALMQVWKPERIRAAASHAAEHHGVPPLDEDVDYRPLPEG
jgi:amino acid transporter